MTPKPRRSWQLNKTIFDELSTEELQLMNGWCNKIEEAERKASQYRSAYKAIYQRGWKRSRKKIK